MELKPQAEHSLREYLLGELSAEQQENTELWLFSEESAYDQVNAAEDALIDDFLAGKLTGGQVSRFNDYFLLAPERRFKLQFSRSFKRFVETADVPVAIPASGSFSLWNTLANCFRYSPGPAYAVATLILVMAVGNVWLTFRTARLQQELGSAIVLLNESQKSLDESQKLQAQLGVLERIVVAAKPPQGLLAFSLIPGITRDSESEIQNVHVTDNPVDVVLFSLNVDDVYRSYNIVLLDAEGRLKFTRTGLLAINTNSGRTVVVTVPNGELLGDGPYTLKLSGVSDSGQDEGINSYPFRPVHP